MDDPSIIIKSIVEGNKILDDNEEYKKFISDNPRQANTVIKRKPPDKSKGKGWSKWNIIRRDEYDTGRMVQCSCGYMCSPIQMVNHKKSQLHAVIEEMRQKGFLKHKKQIRRGDGIDCLKCGFAMKAHGYVNHQRKCGFTKRDSRINKNNFPDGMVVRTNTNGETISGMDYIPIELDVEEDGRKELEMVHYNFDATNRESISNSSNVSQFYNSD
jgi:hypothetical protein